jgi:AcrR family transcriptional regulator
VLTETGYLAAGIDAVIKNIAVPKGSFYHCFKSKEAFGLAVLAAYGDFFAHKLDKFLLTTPCRRWNEWRPSCVMPVREWRNTSFVAAAWWATCCRKRRCYPRRFTSD